MQPDDLFILEYSSTEMPMSAERRQILDMLAQGKISADDAEKLLAKLESAAPAAASGPAPRFLRVMVDSEDGDKVNIRVPLALVRTGVKLTAMMPREAGERLEEKGIDLSRIAGLEGEELIGALRELTVDVQSEDGDQVKIFCE